MNAADFQLASAQASLFTPGEDVSSSRLLRELLPRWAERFNGNPTILPSEGLPPDVPKVFIQSTTSVWRCEIASGRINYYWYRPTNTHADPILSIPAFYEEAVKALGEYVAWLGARVGRVAAVVNRFASNEAPGLLLAKHF